MSKIEDICIIGDGAHASIKRCETGVMYLTAKNFNSYGINLSKTEFISQEDYKKHFCKKTNTVISINENDLVFSIIGSIGSPYVVKKGDVFGLSSSVAILRPDKDKISSKFLYYWIISDVFQKYLENIKSGAAQGFLSLGMIKKLPVLILPLNTQKKIADILSAYDDLIENNNRRIELLEKAAQNLYKEWFVRFRFPNHKQTKFENGLPLGWTIIKLEDISEFAYGKMPNKDKRRDFGYQIFSGYRVVGYYDEFMYEDEMLIIVARGVGGTGDVKFSPPKSYITNLSIIFLLKDNNLVKNYLYQMFNINSLRYLDTGSAQSQITIDNLKRVKIILPSRSLLEQYDEHIKLIRKQVKNIQTQNHNLIKQRDLLLPRLMSGKLEV